MAPKLNFHPTADLFPMISGGELDAFREDLKTNGVREPVTFYKTPKGKKVYIDGRNRLFVAMEEGIECPEEEYKGDTKKIRQWVLSKNLQGRRHLTSGQKAVVAVRALKMAEAEGEVDERPGDWADNLARDYGTNRNYVFFCKTIEDSAPELNDEVLNGRMTVMDAKTELARRNRPADEVPDPQGGGSTNAEPVESDGGEGGDNAEGGEAADNGTPPAAPDAAPDPEQFPVDGLGAEVPKKFRPVFSKRAEFDRLVGQAKALSEAVEELSAGVGSNWLDATEAKAFARNLENALRSGVPYAVCPSCDGSGKKDGRSGKCTRCERNGYVNKSRYDDDLTVNEGAA